MLAYPEQQFLLANYTLDGTTVEPKIKTLVPKMDYMTAFKPWLDVQVHAFDCCLCCLLAQETCTWLSGRGLFSGSVWRHQQYGLFLWRWMPRQQVVFNSAYTATRLLYCQDCQRDFHLWTQNVSSCTCDTFFSLFQQSNYSSALK